MTSLTEAYELYESTTEHIPNIDHFFTQRTMTEEQEYFDKTLTRQVKVQKKTYNLLEINIKLNHELTYNIEIYGDNGFLYRGQLTTLEGSQPLLMIPIKSDKRIFVNFTTNNNDNKPAKRITTFIDVPKRYQCD
jgi:hypothetical protein